MNKLEKAEAMKCFGKFTETVALDPDPNTYQDLLKEYSCENCSSYDYCAKLQRTLESRV